MSPDGDATSLDVLIVEDNPGDLRLIREGFEESDVDVSLTTVTDGEAAIDRLSGEDGTGSEAAPDLTLLDLNLPKVNGRRVLERVGADGGPTDVPVIVLTSSQSDDDVRETFELGADGYFVKPVDPAEFLSLVERIGTAVADSESPPRGRHTGLDRAP